MLVLAAFELAPAYADAAYGFGTGSQGSSLSVPRALVSLPVGWSTMVHNGASASVL